MLIVKKTTFKNIDKNCPSKVKNHPKMVKPYAQIYILPFYFILYREHFSIPVNCSLKILFFNICNSFHIVSFYDMIYITIKWGEYPQTWPGSQGTSVVPRMATATDGLSWILIVIFQFLVISLKKISKAAKIASCLKIQLSLFE